MKCNLFEKDRYFSLYFSKFEVCDLEIRLRLGKSQKNFGFALALH